MKTIRFRVTAAMSLCLSLFPARASSDRTSDQAYAADGHCIEESTNTIKQRFDRRLNAFTNLKAYGVKIQKTPKPSANKQMAQEVYTKNTLRTPEGRIFQRSDHHFHAMNRPDGLYITIENATGTWKIIGEYAILNRVNGLATEASIVPTDQLSTLDIPQDTTGDWSVRFQRFEEWDCEVFTYSLPVSQREARVGVVSNGINKSEPLIGAIEFWFTTHDSFPVRVYKTSTTGRLLHDYKVASYTIDPKTPDDFFDLPKGVKLRVAESPARYTAEMFLAGRNSFGVATTSSGATR